MTCFRAASRHVQPLIAGIFLILLVAGCSSTPTPTAHRPVAYRSADIEGHIRESAARFDVPEEWIRAVMQVESAGMSDATSPVGAMGLMQVMPETYAELRERYDLGDDPYDPRNNILAGTAYIREMYDMFGSPGFLGAYNAGPTRYAQYANEGRRLPGETARYMAILGPQVAGIAPRHPGPADGGYGMFAQAPSVTPVRAVTAVRPVPVATPAPAPVMAASAPPVRPLIPMAPGTTVYASSGAVPSSETFDRGGLATASFTSAPVMPTVASPRSPTIETMIVQSNPMTGQPSAGAPIMLYPATYNSGGSGNQQWVNPDEPRS